MSVLFLSGEGRGNREKEASVTTYNILKSIINENQNMENIFSSLWDFEIIAETSSPVAVL